MRSRDGLAMSLVSKTSSGLRSLVVSGRRCGSSGCSAGCADVGIENVMLGHGEDCSGGIHHVAIWSLFGSRVIWHIKA